LLRLESELQEARLETGQLAELAGRLNSELTRVRSGAGEDARSHADDEVQRLVATIGTPLVQLVTQHHLHRAGTAAFAAGTDFYDHIQHDYAVRWFDRQQGRYEYRTCVNAGTAPGR
jgi:hypothetical protein